MHFYQRFKIPSLNRYRRRAYLSIDTLPVGLWFQINDTNDYNVLITRGRYTDSELGEIWLGVQQEYIDEFGLDSKYVEFLKLKKKLIKMEIDLAITQDRHLENLILIIKSDLDALYSKEKRNFHDNLVLLERSYHIIIDPLTTSVKKYYYYIKNG